jgi:hypothetical protein
MIAKTWFDKEGNSPKVFPASGYLEIFPGVNYSSYTH